MTIIEAAKVCFQKFVKFSGRASRSEYWKFVAFVLLVSVLIVVGHGLVFGPQVTEQFVRTVAADGTEISGKLTVRSYNGGLPGTLFSLACLLPGLAVGVRRLHDIGRSGWWIVVPLVVLFVGVAIVIAASIGFAALLDGLRSAGRVNVRASPVIALPMLLIILASWITLIVWLCRPSQPGPNRYGPNPNEVSP